MKRGCKRYSDEHKLIIFLKIINKTLILKWHQLATNRCGNYSDR